MKRILTVALCVLLAAAAAIAVYRFGFRKSIPNAEQDVQVMAILKQNDCFVCHSTKTEFPAYAKLPVIGPKMKEHVKHAADFIDLDIDLADISNVSEVTLNKLDHAVSYGTMPLAEYRLSHWGTGFTSKEKSILSQWILDTRGSAEPIVPIPSSVDADPKLVALGYSLFNDPRISLDGTITCATCHVLEKGGADHEDERVSEGIDGLKGGVNAPTVYNAGFHIRQFWNGRAADLREQAEGPATNPVEMGDQTWEQICERIGMDKMTATGAIAEFEKTLITPDSRFDLYLKGDSNALTSEEKAGYELFKEYSCASCHGGVAMGGQSFEKLGIYGDYFADRRSDIEFVSDDEGLKSYTGKDEDIYRFKVPGLRNIEKTAPYFHDGQYQTMEEAVRAMTKYELGKDLSDKEVNSIVGFMKTLSGKHELMTE